MKVKSMLMGTAAVCLFAWCFHSHDAMAGDSIVIKCDPSVEPGVIIMTNPPKVSCDDLDLINMFVGTGLEFGPFTDMEKLEQQIAKFQPQAPQVESPWRLPPARVQTPFEIRRDRAYQALDDYNAMIRATAPGYLDDSDVFPDVKGN